MVYGIISRLDEEHTAQINMIWQLWRDMGLTDALPELPTPHFSYHVAESYELVPLANDIQNFASATATFHVRTSGLGLFQSETDTILYIPIVRDLALFEVHEYIIGYAQPHATNSLTYYYPESWLPHITLSSRITDHDLVWELLKTIKKRAFQWHIPITTLEIVSSNNDLPPNAYHYSLQSGDN